MTQRELDTERVLIATRDALDKLHYAVCGHWPLDHETPADIAERIKAAVSKERAATARGERELL